MKLKSWKKRLKEEIDGIVPELRADVKDAPIPVSDCATSSGGNVAVKLRNTRNAIISLIVVAVFGLVVLLTCFAFPSRKKPNAFLFTIEINPAIDILADDKGIVTDVMAANADADVILSAEGVKENIINKKIAVAAVYYTDCAARLGYIDPENDCSAVRVSGCDDEKNEALLKETKNSLETYFLSKGIFAAVIAENVDREQFAERSGIPSGSDEEMRNYIIGNKTLFSEREADGRSLEELQILYGNSENLRDFVTEELSRNIEKLRKNAEDVRNLNDLYLRILRHEDNPATPILKGYWDVKKYYGDKIEGEFAGLVAEMDAALQNYKNDYGVEIKNFFQLQKISNSYISASIERISELIADFTYDVFNKLSSELSEIVAAAGITVTENMSALARLPQTVEEYFTRTKALLKAEYDFRRTEYENIYQAAREPITKKEYESFMAGILSEYGSLEAYWQSIKG